MYYLVTDENNMCLYISKTKVISVNSQNIYELDEVSYTTLRETLGSANDLINWRYDGLNFDPITSIDPNGEVCQKKIKLSGIFESEEFTFNPELYKTNQVQDIPVIIQRETWQGIKGIVDTSSVTNIEAVWEIMGRDSSLVEKEKDEESYILCNLQGTQSSMSKLRFKLLRDIDDINLKGVIIYTTIPAEVEEKEVICVQAIKRATDNNALVAHLTSPQSYKLKNGYNYIEFTTEEMIVGEDYYLELLFFNNSAELTEAQAAYIRKINYLSEINY